MFTEQDYNILYSIVFSGDYSGYKPEVKESPNGDGKIDDCKKYAHVAEKYIKGYSQEKLLREYLSKCHDLSIEIAKKLGVKKDLYPDIKYGALRILDYPPGSISNRHKDFDLFTISCYRNHTDSFKFYNDTVPENIRAINKQLHLGEMIELVDKKYKANPHEVLASENRQKSIVYFSIPDWESVFPVTGQKVGEWLEERYKRSRY